MKSGLAAGPARVALAAFLFLSGIAGAQTPVDTVESLAGIEIETSVDRVEILIGDLVTYNLAIIYDSSYQLVPPPLGANLGAFDVKDYQSDIITRLPNGRIRSDNRFVLSTFTTGDYVIPPIPILFDLPDGTKKVILSEAVPIKVESLLEAAGDTADIHPLKSPYEFRRDMTAYYVWCGLILACLLAAGYLVWRRLRRKKAIVEQLDLRTPWEIAFENLALLKERNLLRDGEFKQYYFELADIARVFLGRIYGVDVMEMTTEEFLLRFREISLPGKLYDTCREFLGHADLVKFAKLVPEGGRAESDLDVVHDMVELVRSDLAQREQVQESMHPDDGERETVSSEVRP